MSMPGVDAGRVLRHARSPSMDGMDVSILVAVIFLAVLGITAQIAGVDSRALDLPTPTD
jgi:hypothetical protein